MANPSSLIHTGSGPLLREPAFTDSEYQRRLAATRRLMEEKGLDIFITFTPENMYYLTGHDSPGYYYLQACVVTHNRLPVVVTRRIESVNTLGGSWSRLSCPYDDSQDPVAVLLELLGELGMAGKSVGLESNAWFITFTQFSALQEGINREASALDASGLVETLRLVKSGEELACIREAGRLCSRAMAVAFEASRAGVTENDVAAKTVARLIGEGSAYAGLPPFISTGPKTSLVHSTWTERVLHEGDVLAYELPGVRARYCAALFRTGIIGKPAAEIERGMAVLVETLDALLAAIRPGVPVNDVHQASLDVFKKHGATTPPRRSAYSLGINYPPDWGEGHIMSFTGTETRPLQSGMVFHVGTGLFEYPRYQLALTESVIVSEDGCEVVTDFPRQLIECGV